jgi:putative ABC transport system permease protein
MLRAALRDLQWRRRRFAITILGTALVFAMSLVMSGLSHSFSVEVDRTLAAQRAEWWVTRSDATGAFSPGSYLSPTDVAALGSPTVGFTDSAPLFYGSSTAQTAPGRSGNEVVTVTLMGVQPGALGAPTAVASGSATLTDGTVIVPRSLDVHVGDTISLSGASMKVVGIVDHASLLGGTPTVTVTLHDAQRMLLGGQPLASMVVARGSAHLPSDYRMFTRVEAKTDLMRPLKNPALSIDIVKVLLWIVAGLIVASVVYLTVLERTRDIAVFKATGVRTVSIAAGICLQAVILAVVASVLGIVLAVVLSPLFPMDVAIAARAMLQLPLLAVLVGILAGLVGARRTTTVAPTTAFGGP